MPLGQLSSCCEIPACDLKSPVVMASTPSSCIVSDSSQPGSTLTIACVDSGAAEAQVRGRPLRGARRWRGHAGHPVRATRRPGTVPDARISPFVPTSDNYSSSYSACRSS